MKPDDTIVDTTFLQLWVAKSPGLTLKAFKPTSYHSMILMIKCEYCLY